MKWFKYLAILPCIVATIDASAQLKAGTMVRTKEVYTSDSVEYYETDFATRQKSYMNLLVGTWTIYSMKRQAKIDAEHISGVTLTLNADSTFSGQASCNRVSGKFSIKGTSVKFQEIVSTKMTCDQQEQETWLLRLLEQTVSAYSVNKKTLFLRDGASNVVFEGAK